MDPNEITILVKEGHEEELSDYDFKVMHETYPYQTDYLMIKGLDFETNIMYLN